MSVGWSAAPPRRASRRARAAVETAPRSAAERARAGAAARRCNCSGAC